ncbi:MAG: antitoxin [Sphaerospermopsis sp. SIO1G1]|nr:antitoxin [Sphaerospermopsis sp. SIO1G1]
MIFISSIKNPYFQRLKKQLAIDLEKDIIQYFEEIAQETGISYLSLINLYWRECMENKRKLSLIKSNS